jgi:hypothetical protein
LTLWVSFRGRRSNANLLHLVEAHVTAAPVVRASGARAFVRCHLLRGFKQASVLEAAGYPDIDREIASEPLVCGLSAGGRWFGTIGSCRRAVVPVTENAEPF